MTQRLNLNQQLPSSQVGQISKIVEHIMRLNPQAVLDIGAGFGKYGILLREYLEYWGVNASLKWKRRIDAIEVFSNYITPLHCFVYDTIWTADVTQILYRCVNYDLVLLIDVLEHFHKAEGTALLEYLIDHNKSVLVSTPKRFEEQSDVFGNKYERHKSIWTEEEFRVLGNTEFINDNQSLICVLEKKYGLKL